MVGNVGGASLQVKAYLWVGRDWINRLCHLEEQEVVVEEVVGLEELLGEEL